MKPAVEPSSCFVARTLIRTAEGDRPVESLRVGDAVQSIDVGNWKRSHQPLVATHERRVRALVDIEVGAVTITCSPEHPFWIARTGWRQAGALEPGATLLGRGGEIAIGDVRRREGDFTVFNLEVGGLHVFEVSPLGILVHNKASANAFYKNRKAIVEQLEADAKALAELEAKKSAEELTVAEEELITPAAEEQATLSESVEALGVDMAEAKKPYATRMQELTESVDSVEKRRTEVHTRNDEALNAATSARAVATDAKARAQADKQVANATQRNKDIWALQERLDAVKRTAKLLTEDPSSDSGVTLQKAEVTAIERLLAKLEAQVTPGGMLGAEGPQITSKTLWEGDDGYERIDVENPDPGGRPGQIHYQPDKKNKWYYDPEKNDFYNQKTGKRAPKSVNDKLNDPDFKAAIDEGLRQLKGGAKK
jgi:hypothetical protein